MPGRGRVRGQRGVSQACETRMLDGRGHAMAGCDAGYGDRGNAWAAQDAAPSTRSLDPGLAAGDIHLKAGDACPRDREELPGQGKAAREPGGGHEPLKTPLLPPPRSDP